MQNAIEVKNLKVVFPDRGRMIRAVEGVDLTVKKGECLALVGESGCGKSMTSFIVHEITAVFGGGAAGSAVYLRGRCYRLHRPSDAGTARQ
ncbi:MAG: ATP-binding cassette domain-containing protein [Lachnospira sp.]